MKPLTILRHPAFVVCLMLGLFGLMGAVGVTNGPSGSTGATDNAILRADGTGGNLLQTSSATINDSGHINAVRSTFSGDATAYLSSPFAGALAITNPTTTFWFITGYVQINSDASGFAFGTTTDTYVKRGGAAGVVAIEGGSNAGGTIRYPARTATQITSNQDNFNPGGRSYFQRWSTDASRNVTGMVFASAGVDGETHLIVNVGSTDIVLKHQTTSTAANQFKNSTGADITLTANQAADVIYDGTQSRWLVFKKN